MWNQNRIGKDGWRSKRFGNFVRRFAGKVSSIYSSSPQSDAEYETFSGSNVNMSRSSSRPPSYDTGTSHRLDLLSLVGSFIEEPRGPVEYYQPPRIAGQNKSVVRSHYVPGQVCRARDTGHIRNALPNSLFDQFENNFPEACAVDCEHQASRDISTAHNEIDETSSQEKHRSEALAILNGLSGREKHDLQKLMRRERRNNPFQIESHSSVSLASCANASGQYTLLNHSNSTHSEYAKSDMETPLESPDKHFPSRPVSGREVPLVREKPSVITIPPHTGTMSPVDSTSVRKLQSPEAVSPSITSAKCPVTSFQAESLQGGSPTVASVSEDESQAQNPEDNLGGKWFAHVHAPWVERTWRLSDGYAVAETSLKDFVAQSNGDLIAFSDFDLLGYPGYPENGFLARNNASRPSLAGERQQSFPGSGGSQERQREKLPIRQSKQSRSAKSKFTGWFSRRRLGGSR